MATADAGGQTSRERRRWGYERVVETVRQQTGGTQEPTIPESNLRQVCCSSGSLDVDEYRSALAAAEQNGDLFRWHGQVVLVEPDALVAALEAEAGSEHPRSAFVARLNQLLQEARS